MPKRGSDLWHGCPVRFGATVLGDPWTLLILRDLMFRDARHYGDFARAGERISTNILADRLQWLEGEGILVKTRDPDWAVRVIYRLTEKGRGLVPVILSIIDWSEAWDDKTEVPADFIAAYRADPAGFAASIQESLRQDAARDGAA
ncbi:winged helix-turn-helix transcriptional regulator [Pseudooceanicola sp. MF1-13]|uniref:winged helix-turn-helix transcriptional regulator n=1 Tax=Pseudooceanicola sp. MF1-13 TaxID=3379095 RepID=UPI003892646B